MKDARTRKSFVSFGAAALLAVGAATAQVGTMGTPIDNSGSFQSEVQACRSGKTQQSQEDCLREARNAASDKQRGRLETYSDHAGLRCEVHASAEDRAACRARVMGMGDSSGSVAGGGMLYQSETVVMPQGQSSITVQPQTTNDVIVLVPSTNTMGAGNR
jgi:hypothetical protein